MGIQVASDRHKPHDDKQQPPLSHALPAPVLRQPGHVLWYPGSRQRKRVTGAVTARPSAEDGGGVTASARGEPARGPACTRAILRPGRARRPGECKRAGPAGVSGRPSAGAVRWLMVFKLLSSLFCCCHEHKSDTSPL